MAKNVVITGAAGGIGKEVVRLFLDGDYNTKALDINTLNLSEWHNRDNLECIKVDVTNENELSSFTGTAGIESLDILILAAGIYDSWPVSEIETESFRKMMEVNLLSAQNLIRRFLNPLIRAKGRIIIVSSESVKMPALFQPYMISKIALEAFAMTARQELGLKGVKVAIIRPGAVNTGLLGWMKKDGSLDYASVFEQEYRRSFLKSLRLVGKPAEPEKVAKLIYKAAISKRPRRVYNINHNLHLSIISKLPESLTEKIIIRKFRNP